jgi:F420H(2)-dependent quinone reductase
VSRTPKPYTPHQERFRRRRTRFIRALDMWLYRKTNGRIGGKLPGTTAPICLFTTTGRRTGLARTVPLVYAEDGDDVIVVASAHGMSKNPDWYLNLLANPKATVEIDGDARAMVARTATPEEKARVWPRLVAMNKWFANDQRRTTREFPVIVCTPGV